jgi:hypothetical protein
MISHPINECPCPPDGAVLGVVIIMVNGTPWLYDDHILIFENEKEAEAYASGFESGNRIEVLYTETGDRLLDARQYPDDYRAQLSLVEQTFALVRSTDPRTPVERG